MKHDETGKLESFLERVLFNNRIWVLILFGLITLFLGYRATLVRPDIDLTKMVPQGHSYVQNAKKIFSKSSNNLTTTEYVAFSSSTF